MLKEILRFKQYNTTEMLLLRLQSSSSVFKKALTGVVLLAYWCIVQARMKLTEISSPTLSLSCVSLVYLRWPTFITCIPGSYTGCQLLDNPLDQPSENWTRGVTYVLAQSQGTQRHCLTFNQVIKSNREIKALIAFWSSGELITNSTCCYVVAVYGAIGIQIEKGKFNMWVRDRKILMS